MTRECIWATVEAIATHIQKHTMPSYKVCTNWELEESSFDFARNCLPMTPYSQIKASYNIILYLNQRVGQPKCLLNTPSKSFMGILSCVPRICFKVYWQLQKSIKLSYWIRMRQKMVLILKMVCSKRYAIHHSTIGDKSTFARLFESPLIMLRWNLLRNTWMKIVWA